MRRALPILAVLALVAVTASAADLQWGICTRVIDGDTIVVMPSAGKKVRVRLYGIDCPEKGEPFAEVSTAYIAALVLGKRVSLEPVDTDRYGRMVAWVSVGNLSVNRELLRAGMAWWYRKYARHHPELGRLEAEARHGCRGLWSMCSSEFQAE